MNQASRNEQNYRMAMDALRFSEADKENLVENLIAAEPVKRRSVRSMRVGLIAACLCLVLAGTAFAATVVYRLTVEIGPDERNEEYFGYTVRGGPNVQYPLSAFSPELIAASEGREDPLMGVKRAFRTKEEVQAFLGEDIPCVFPEGWDDAYYDVVLFHVQHDQEQTDPNGELTMVTVYSVSKGRWPVMLTLSMSTENLLEADVDRAGGWYSNWETQMEQLDSYTMANGCTAEIILETLGEEEKSFTCHGVFVKDGISYQLETFSKVSEAALIQLQNVLDSFP